MNIADQRHLFSLPYGNILATGLSAKNRCGVKPLGCQQLSVDGAAPYQVLMGPTTAIWDPRNMSTDASYGTLWKFNFSSWQPRKKTCVINTGMFSLFPNSLYREGVEAQQHQSFWSGATPGTNADDSHLNKFYLHRTEKEQKATADGYLRATARKQNYKSLKG